MSLEFQGSSILVVYLCRTSRNRIDPVLLVESLDPPMPRLLSVKIKWSHIVHGGRLLDRILALSFTNYMQGLD